MDSPTIVEQGPLYPHKDIFSHAVSNLADTHIDLVDDFGGRRIRMYLSLETVEQVAAAYDKTLRGASDLHDAIDRVNAMTDVPVIDQLMAENDQLRKALIAVCARRPATAATVDAIGKALGRDINPDTIAFVSHLKMIGR